MCRGSRHVSYSPLRFLEIGSPILKRHDLVRNNAAERRWMATFGAKVEVISNLWDLCKPYDTLPDGVKPVHILWGLLFLKLYQTETVNSQLVGGVDEKTFRKWAGLFVELISYQEGKVILWSNRFRGDIGNKCLVSVDGTDQMIFEPGGFNSDYLTHKFNHAGLKYEVGVNIRMGDIVWIHGPFRGGENDMNIARSAIIGFLDENERVEADRGYVGQSNKINTPVGRSAEARRMAAEVRARHETVNERLKNFMVLCGVFRHDPEKHVACFRAVAVITQLSFEHGNRPFQVDYVVK